MTVLNVWRVLNLRESPFYQDTLSPAAGAAYPIELFVGREEETNRILRSIGSLRHSRQAIQGGVGIGKTSLVQRVKAEVVKSGYLTLPEAAALGHADTTETVLLRILNYVYEAILAQGGLAVGTIEVMQTARQVLHAFRTRAGGASVGWGGLGSIGISTSAGHITPSGAAPIYLPRLLRQLSDLVLEKLKRPGVVVHLNNLENLSDADSRRAAQIVRDLRDEGLMYDGLHYLFVGTESSVTAITSAAQVRSVFTSHILRPLDAVELERLLEKRYRHLRLDRKRKVHPPVERETLHALYGLFQGDLRGTLRALETAAMDLVGLGETPSAPMTASDMRSVLLSRYHAELEQLSDSTREYLQLMSEAGDVGHGFTQQDLMSIWGIGQSAVSSFLSDLIRAGYVIPAERVPTGGPGRPRQLYRLGGPALLVFRGLPGESDG
ncbi:MAG: ATP-binding protein [Gemmatimonadetes bacterium]|nr:ATP-binding protein [Gemmatimonadota bacterium]